MRTRILPPVLLLATACGGSGSNIGVTATDSFCQVDKINVKAGTHTFAMTNNSSAAADLALFTEGNRLVADTAEIGAGQSARLKVKLGTGQYQIACRPGGTGAGKRALIYVASETGQDPGIKPPDADREVAFTAKDFRFDGLNQLTTTEGQVSGGEVLSFRMTNNGPSQHEFRVTGPDGKLLGAIERIGVGKIGTVTVIPERGGTVTYFCGIADHAQRGLKGTFTVVA